MSIILANFGKYAISDCPFITYVYVQVPLIINYSLSPLWIEPKKIRQIFRNFGGGVINVEHGITLVNLAAGLLYWVFSALVNTMTNNNALA